MNKLRLFRIIDQIDDDLIKEAEINTERLSAPEDSFIESGNSSEVSGVEIYRRTKWQRFSIAAAALLLVAGIGAGGVLMLKDHSPKLTGEAPAVPSESVEVRAVQLTSENEAINSEEAAAGKTSDKKETSTVESIASDTHEEELSAPSQSPLDQEDPVEKPTNVRAEGWCRTIAEEPTEAPTKNEKPAVTAPDVPAATVPPKEPEAEIPTATDDLVFETGLFRKLNALNYQPMTCDGLPEYQIQDNEGNVFEVNLSSGWVWRRNPTNGKPEPEEANLTSETLSILKSLKDRGELYPCVWF